MKTLLLSFFTTFLSLTAFSQAQNPVTWRAAYKPLSQSEGEIVITASIEKGWHTYSQKITADGPIPTSFTFAPSPNYKAEGKTMESDAHEEYVPAFEAKIFVFTDKAEFRQKIRRVSKNSFDLPLKLEFMSCNDMMCLPPKTIDLTVRVQ